jgi:hypothetical protein
MGIFKNIFGNLFDDNDNGPEINPATGLPMIDNSGIDVNGNPFGIDNDDFSNSGINNDDFSNNSFSGGDLDLGSNDIFNNTDDFNNSGFGDDDF